MKKINLKKFEEVMRIIVFTVIGVALITWAIIPTPDDVTIISPIVIFGVGVAFIYNGWKVQFKKIKW